MNDVKVSIPAFVFGLIIGPLIVYAWRKISNGYFLSPTNGEFEYKWAIRQFLRLFSKDASERWYETICIKSLTLKDAILVTLKMRTFLRIDYLDDDERKGYVETLRYDRWLSVEEIKHEFETRADSYLRPGHYTYQLYVCGRNVVWDFMSGYLR